MNETATTARFRVLQPGMPAPTFRQRCTSNPSYVFDTAGGRYIVLCFFATAADAPGQAALAWLNANRGQFDDDHLAFFGVSLDPDDERTGRVQASIPGVRHVWDVDGSVSRLYGALSTDGPQRLVRRLWVLINPGMQVMAVLPFAPDGSDRAALDRLLASLPPVDRYAGMDMHAPVLMVPQVLDAALCRRLMQEYVQHGGEASGFMQERDGKTVGVHDLSHKSRTDHLIQDAALRRLLYQRVQQTVMPMIRRAHCFEVTRMERFLVGCYDSGSGGHFRAHRDNTTRGTAHRRFALTVNLNAEFEGGELVFPEYGSRRYKPPPGAAIVFSGSLLHAVTPVTSGRRFAFLPFLYDEAAARLREANTPFVEGELANYRA